MKRIVTVNCGQYAYTFDGRVVRIDSVEEDGKKLRGHDINLGESAEIELENKDIYGILRNF